MSLKSCGTNETPLYDNKFSKNQATPNVRIKNSIGRYD